METPGNVRRVYATRLASDSVELSLRGRSTRGGRLGGQGGAPRDQQRRGQSAVAHCAAHVEVGGDVAARADRVALGAGHVADADQRGRVHRSGQRSRRNLSGDGFEALYPRYRGGRPQTFTLPMRQEIKRSALSDPQDLGLPFSTWSLSKVADYLVAEGVVTDISYDGLRQLLHQEGVRFQAVRTWKRSNDSEFKPKRDRIVELYAAAEAGEAVVICLDEFGSLNLQPQPGGMGWAPRAKPKRARATYSVRTASGT
jgi:transposase